MRIDQAEFAALAGRSRYSPENKVVFTAVELAAAARLHQIDEARVDFPLDRLEPRHVLGLLRQERIEHRLVLAGGVEPPLDADLLDQLGEAERAADHADRTDDRGRVGRRSRRPRRRSCSRRRRATSSTKAITGIFFSSASCGCAGRSDATAPREPPGELIDSATARRCACEGAFQRARGLASVRPGRSGVEKPITPESRTTGTTGMSPRNRAGTKPAQAPKMARFAEASPPWA